MKKILIYGLLGCLLLFIGVNWLPDMLHYNPLAQYDLKRYCKFVSERKFAEPKDIEGTINDAVALTSFPFYSQAARNIRSALSVASPSQKYGFYQQAAKEVGIGDYQCPALKTYFENVKP